MAIESSKRTERERILKETEKEMSEFKKRMIEQSPTQQDKINSMRWLAEQHPDAVKMYPQLFDENNIPSEFCFGMDVERMKQTAEDYPLINNAADIFSALTFDRAKLTYLDIYTPEFHAAHDTGSPEAVKLDDGDNHVETRRWRYFKDNQIKETQRIMSFYLDALDAFGAEYYPSPENETPEQGRLFSQADVESQDDAAAVEAQRLKVWPEYHCYNRSYISQILLIGRLIIDGTLKVYEQHPEYSLKETDAAIIKLMPALPVNFNYPNDKVSSEFWRVSTVLCNGKFHTDLASKNKPERQMFVTLNLDKDVIEKFGIKGYERLSDFDRQVHDAIATLDREYFDTQQIWETMCGKKRVKLHDKTRERIIDSVMRMMCRLVDIRPQCDFADVTAKSRYFGSILTIEYINQEVIKKQGRSIKDCWHLLRQPVLYNFAKALGQIITGPLEMLDTPVNKTTEILALQNYLLRRVKSSFSQRIILYDTLFKAIGFDVEKYEKKDTGVTMRKRLIKYTKTILDKWVEMNQLKGYTVKKKGRAEIGIELQRIGEPEKLRPAPQKIDCDNLYP